MSSLNRWLNREIAREGRAVYLEDALLSGRFAAYACYRLRYFFGRSLVEAAIHIIEFTFLAIIFKQHALISVLFIRASSNFLSAWWWGALENMRGHVRNLHREGKTRLVPKILSRWFALALMTAAGLLLVTVGWIFLDSTRAGQEFDIFHFYVLAVVIRLALGIVSRTYHSAVYAIRRIYRPFVAIVGVELMGFVVTLFLWPSLGVWSFPLAQIPTGIVAAILTFIYVSRVYRFLGFQKLRWRQTRSFQGVLPRMLSKDFFLAGCAYGFMQLDFILVLSLFFGARESTQGFRLFLFFYLIGPFVRSGYEWAQLFYFDLKRLELDLFSYFKKRFTRLVRQVAVAVGLLFWIITCACGTVLVQQNLGMVYALLLLFFLVRSQLAFNQIRAFAERRYPTLIFMGFMIVGGVLLARWATAQEAERLGLFSLVLLAALICLAINNTFGLRMDRRSRIVSLPDWLTRLRQIQNSVRVRVISLDYQVGGWLVERIGRDILGLVRSGAMTQIGHRRLAWYEIHKGTKSPSDASILKRGGGLIESIRSSPSVPNGRQAISVIEENRIIEALPDAASRAKVFTYSTPAIKQRFRKVFPKGILYDATDRNMVPLSGVSRSDRRQLMAGAIQYSKNLFRRIRRGRFDVTSLFDNGRIRLIFAVPQSEPEPSRKKWKSFINEVNLSHAIHSKMKQGKENAMKVMQIRPGLLWTLGGALALLAVVMIPIKDRISGAVLMKPEEHTKLYAPLAAFVKEVEYREGDSVSAGKTVAEFEIPDLKSRIAQKQAEEKEVEAMYRLLQAGPRHEELTEQRARVQRANTWRDKAQAELEKALTEYNAQIAGKIEESHSEFEFAQEEHQRAKQLYEENVISLDSYKNAKRELEVRKARKKQALAEEGARSALLVLETESDLVQRERDLAEARATLNLMEAGTRPELLEAKRAELERVREELAYLQQTKERQTLRSPIHGTIVTPDLHMKKGTFLQEGELFCEVVDASRVKVEIAVPEHAAARVKQGQPIEVKPRALPYQTFEGTVDRIAPVVDQSETNSTARIYCWIENHNQHLRPGMSGYARVYLGTRPLGAVLLDRLSRFVRREFWW